VEDIDENQAFCDLVNASLTGWILFLPDHEIKLSFQNPFWCVLGEVDFSFLFYRFHSSSDKQGAYGETRQI